MAKNLVGVFIGIVFISLFVFFPVVEILSASSATAANVERDAYKVALNNMLTEKEKAKINEQVSNNNMCFILISII